MKVAIDMMTVKVDRPIFVIGTPRSGTTLIAKILGRHPDLFMPGETHYFDDIYARRDELGSIDNIAACQSIANRLSTLYERFYEPPDQERIDRLFCNRDMANEILESCGNYADVLAWFMSMQMQEAGKSRWGNNAPRDLFHYKEILEFYPDAKFVVCVRDLRDFLLSYKGKWKVTGDEHVERLKKLYHPVITSLLWKSSMRLLEEIKETIHEDNLVVVHYENLVQEPERTVQGICSIIDIEYTTVLLDVNSHNSSTEKQASGIFKTSIERWRKELTPEEIQISQWLAGREMGNLGYQVAKTNTSKMKLFILIASTPLSLWRALEANKSVRGPLRPYLAKRIASLIGMKMTLTKQKGTK